MNLNNILPQCNVKINLIVGTDLNGAIGYKNRVLFDCPQDTQFYMVRTKNTIVVMGRGTLQSIDNKVLPDCLNIVVSSTLSDKDYPQYNSDQLLIFTDFVSVIDYLNQSLPTRDVFIIGGESVYEWFMVNNYVDDIYLNIIDKRAERGDRFFPSSLYENKYQQVYNKPHTWLVDSVETTVWEQKYSRK